MDKMQELLKQRAEIRKRLSNSNVVDGWSFGEHHVK